MPSRARNQNDIVQSWQFVTSFPKRLYGYAFVMVMIYGGVSQQEDKVMRREIAAMAGQSTLGESCTI